MKKLTFVLVLLSGCGHAQPPLPATTPATPARVEPTLDLATKSSEAVPVRPNETIFRNGAEYAIVERRYPRSSEEIFACTTDLIELQTYGQMSSNSRMMHSWVLVVRPLTGGDDLIEYERFLSIQQVWQASQPRRGRLFR